MCVFKKIKIDAFYQIINLIFLFEGVSHADDISLILENSFMHRNAKDYEMQAKIIQWIVSFAKDG